jgi:hypothetical protein
LRKRERCALENVPSVGLKALTNFIIDSPRIHRIRRDKPFREADTLETLETLLT